MIPQDFVRKWSGVTGNERKLYQQHFLDLCELVSHPKPADDDPTGERFTFEAGVTKASGGQGFADVWKKGYFAWEYKGHHADLTKAYQQLLQYKDSLFNPPLLVVSDIHRILIHTNFTNTPKRIVELGLDDLLTPTGLAQLRAVFFAPESFRADKTTEQVTREAAEQFGHLAALLHLQGHAPERVAHCSSACSLKTSACCRIACSRGWWTAAVFTRTRSINNSGNSLRIWPRAASSASTKSATSTAASSTAVTP